MDICVSNVIDLYGWEFKLGWNTTILDAVSVSEGQFLKSGGATFFTYKINNTLGYMVVDCTLLGSVSGVSGSGILATVKFYVEGVGECPIDLYDSVLINSAEEAIKHTAVDGYYCTSVHDVAVIDLTASLKEVNVTVENQGTRTEIFNVSVYYTYLFDPLIGTRTATLDKGEIATLTFKWDPPFSGRYEIRAKISRLLGETDIMDNEYTTVIHVGYGVSSLKVQNANSASVCHFALGASIFGLIVAMFKPFNKHTFPYNLKVRHLHAENVWQYLAINRSRIM